MKYFFFGLLKKIYTPVLFFLRKLLGTQYIIEQVKCVEHKINLQNIELDYQRKGLDSQRKEIAGQRRLLELHAALQQLSRAKTEINEPQFMLSSSMRLDIATLLNIKLYTSIIFSDTHAGLRKNLLASWEKSDHDFSYLDIAGIRIANFLKNDSGISVDVFWEIFVRSFFMYYFFDDKYDGKLVAHVENEIGHIRCYKDSACDVTISKHDVVIDAGAWIGDFSAYAACKGAIVYAFEPTEETYQLLCDTAKLNPAIRPEKLCLSDSTGEITFFLCENGAGNGAYREVKEVLLERNLSMTVPAITLDDFVIQRNIEKVDFIKSDIEGGERYLLKGATHVLRKDAPKLAISTYHLPDDPEVLEQIILEANPTYKIVQLQTVLYATGQPVDN